MSKPTRDVTDAKVLSALSHPLRSRLLDILKVDGPATASTLAERTDQAVGNISHHLKVLAQCELIAEAPELAKDRRERWWRTIPMRIRWSSESFVDDASAEAVARAASSRNLEKHFELARAALMAEEEDDQTFSTDTWLRMTSEELVQLSEQIVAVVQQWADRDLPDDGQERRPSYFFAHGFPAQP
ncbi:MAG: ArsR/SmtB family transcription factor [Jatrophihabitans sp.]